MKKYIYIVVISLILPIVSLAQNRYWVANAAGNWNNTANWSTSSGGVGGASVPVAGNFVFFNANGLGNCTLDVAANFDGINTSNYTGVIDLNGFALNPNVGGTSFCIFGGGIFNDTPSSQTLSFTTSNYIRFSGANFNVPINIIAGRVAFNGGVFNSSVIVEDNGGSSTNGQGGCTFNADVKITNSGTSYFLMGQANSDIFNGNLELINTSSSRMRIAYASLGNEINGNIKLSNTGGGIWFGENGGVVDLASSKSVSIGVLGFDKNELRFKNFRQLGSTAQSLSLTGTAILRFESGTVFNGNVDFDAPRILLNGATFNGTSDFEKTGTSSDAGTGNNLFVGDCIVKNSGSGYLVLGSGNPDSFTNNLLLHNVGASTIYFAYNSLGNTVGGDLSIVQNPTGNATVVISSLTSSLNVTGDISVVNKGNGNYQYIELGNKGSLTIGGDLDIQNGMTGTGNNFIVTVADEASSNVSVGGITTVSNGGSGSASRIYLGGDGDVVFNGDLKIDNNSTASGSEIHCNYRASSHNIYNENITVESYVANCDGIWFGNAGGSGVLAANKTVTPTYFSPTNSLALVPQITSASS